MVLDLTNKTLYSCQMLPMTAKNGANILRIVLKASYYIKKDGTVYLSDEQPEIVMEDQYWGEPGQSSVRYESDIVLDKPYTDIVVNGYARALGERPVKQMDVSLAYQGRTIKTVRVFGDRRWDKGLYGWRMAPPEPFQRMPLTYDRAYGGSDEKGSEPRNRSGVGYVTSLDKKFIGSLVPNVEFPKDLIRRPKDSPPPAGFGIISKHWEPRLSFAGTYDELWLKDGFPLLPDDFDMRFNQSVMPDQWIKERPKGCEIIEIKGMTTEGIFRIELPSCEMNIALYYTDRSEEKMMDLDTVLIEPDEKKVILTWRATADIHGNPFQLDNIVISTPKE